MRIETMISAVQQAVGVSVDGKAGPQTWSAIYNALVTPEARVRFVAESDQIDQRSEKNIATLLPHVQPIARALVHKAASVGITIKVISSSRSYAEQNALYAQGRTVLGPIVTNAKAGYSSHNFGIAFDVGVFEGMKYLKDSPQYRVVGALGMDLGLEWGGNWKTLVDQPHFQLSPPWAKGLSERDMLAELRRRVAEDERATA